MEEYVFVFLKVGCVWPADILFLVKKSEILFEYCSELFGWVSYYKEEGGEIFL